MNQSVKQIIRIQEYIPSFIPYGFLEIGSFDGADSLLVKEHYDIPVYAIEANVTQFNNRMLCLSDKISVYCFLASNINGEHDFYNITSGAIGIQGKSSVFLDKLFYISRKEKTRVLAKRIDDFLQETGICVNFAKIDVEGYAYQVLLGFGSRIDDFQAIQVETEDIEIWHGQKTWHYVNEYLMSNGFSLVDKVTYRNQSDCLYIKSNGT